MLRHLYNRAFGSALGDNAWYICVEVFWATIFAGALSFAGAFAIRLGASNAEVSLLTSLTALTAALVLTPAGRFLQKRRRPKNWILSALLLYRVGTLLFVLLPWLEVGLPQGTLLVIIFTLLNFPMHFFNLGFIPLLAEAIPESQRADAFTARNVVQGAGMALSTFVLGLWLGRVPYPVNYQSLFAFGFVMAMISLYYLAKVKVPDAQPPAASVTETAARPKSPFKRGAGSFTAPFKVQAFRRIFANSFVFSVGLWAAAPLYLLYPVRALGASEAWLGAYGAIGNVATIFGYLFWRRLITRWGEPKVLKYTVLGIGFFPLLMGSTPSLALILVLVGLNGLIIAGFNLSHFNTFLKAMPEGERHNATASYMTLANIGAFIAPLVAVWLGGEHYGFGAVLVVCGLLTIAGSLSFWLWPVGEASQSQPVLRPEEG